MSFVLLSLFICLAVLLPPISSFKYTGDIRAHDPSFIKAGECYYIFSTQESEWHNGNIPIRRLCNDSSEKVAALFDTKPEWFQNFTKVDPHMWAPDINYFNDQFYVYYAGSSMGSRNSAIGLATALNITGPYTDQGEVLHTSEDLEYNAIDPTVEWTIENGTRTQMWLIFGSYWTGLKARRLDMTTGKLSTEDTTLYSLASRQGTGTDAIEASSTAYRNGYYYLFVSFDKCCSGSDSTYRVMVGRSKNITGPYVDRDGVEMMKGGGTEILATHENVHGPGGEDIYVDDGIYRMIHHWYDADENGAVKFDIVDLVWNDDWPEVGPESELNYN